MRAGNPFTVVPWYNPHQFYKVHRAIFSNDVTEKRWAIDQISVWETRCTVALPTAVEATAILCRAIIQDILHDNIASFCHDADIQCIYALALVRFVNLIVELRQEGKQRLSLLMLAQEEGIPPWIVNVRNQITHQRCPSLPVLRAAADHAMKHLKRIYWEVEEKQIQSFIKDVKCSESRIFDLITSFKEYKYKEIKEEVECTREILNVVYNLEKYMRVNRVRFVELLTYPGMFVFSAEELKYILTGIDADFLRDKERIELPDVLEYFWDKILYLLVKYDLISDFAELLLLTQEGRDPLSQKLAVCWVFKIIRSVVFEKNNSSLFVTYFKWHGVYINWKRLLFACCKCPCLQTPSLFPIITTHLKMKKKYLAALMYLVAIFQGHAIDKKKGSKSLGAKKFFTVEDAIQKKQAEDTVRDNIVSKGNLWSHSSAELDFATLPIGAILNPVDAAHSSVEMNDEENEEKFIIINVEEADSDFSGEDFDGRNSENEGNEEAEDNCFINPDVLADDMIYRKRSEK